MKVTPGPVPGGHLNRERNLLPFLEARKTPVPEHLTLSAYNALGVRARTAFDARRVNRIRSNTDIMTPGLKDVLLEVRRAAMFKDLPVGRRGVILSGKPTTGKTTAATYALSEGLQSHAREHPTWKELGHSPVVYVEVPDSCSPKNLMGCFLSFLGVPYTSRMTAEERTELAIHHLVEGRTSLIVIDEMQNMAFDSHGHSETQQATKNLMNAVPAVPLYVGFNLEDKLRSNKGLGDQFAGRSSFVALDHFEVDTEEERRLWGGIVYAFEQQLGLLAQEPRSLLLLADYLWDRTSGSIGTLSRLLTTVALDLIATGDPGNEFITEQHLETVRGDLVSERAYQRTRKNEAKAKKVMSRAA
ncbi:AAA family ATPase [Microbacterium sp. AGC62]